MTHFRWTAFALLSLTIPHAASAKAATAPHSALIWELELRPHVENF